MLVFKDRFESNKPKKNYNYEECANCNLYNKSCQKCDFLKTTQGWTSGNKNIDECIKGFQLKATKYEDVIEWIPFNRLDNVRKIGEGGFGLVFSATWLDGKIIGRQSRTLPYIVALKTLPGSQKNFLREFKSYMEVRLVGCNLEVYGLTQNTTNNEYMMVFQYANKGSLHQFLASNFKKLNWKIKLKQLVDMSRNLSKVHNAEYVHKDLHSGNILQHQYNNEKEIRSYITDLGLSRKKDESDLCDDIYGVLPYVAPEVLNKRSYTSAADIYSFGIIMTEISTGMPPHYEVEYDKALAFQICNGLRPEFSKGTPKCYIKLANRCMDANPSNRPSASYIFDKLLRWYHIVNFGGKDTNEVTMYMEFQSADKIIQTLPTELPICPKDKLTSKLLNFKNLSEPINFPPAELLKTYGNVNNYIIVSGF
ncbi:kinase-like domain-containing protein [Gigaspora rosea]|uniref:Kinase-like domain-containing protein n=1 Tax=Gigaspora rosea TaxID=44941 RepID=A0A397V7G1_9GLOM|nr:kinase-like domain-containing protein [Gigaspora rosea]